MPEPSYILTAMLIAGAITFALRAVPFVIIDPLRDSRLVAYLGERMPMGIMIILTVYTLKDVDFGAASSFVPALVGLGITIGLQLWRHNAILSIFGGTVAYTLLASLVFAG